MSITATLLPELKMMASAGARWIAGVDEVGRGALAGPVTVGVVVIDLQAVPAEVSTDGVWPALNGVRDSKLLSPAARQRWSPLIREQVATWSVQHQGPCRIDAAGITASLGEAGRAGLREVESALGREVDAVILDGTHDWLTGGRSPRVHTMPKADTLSLSVACASVLAKVTRDQMMVDLSRQHPHYAWDSNKGYGSAAHRSALRERGVTPHHRRSWNLGVEPLPGMGSL